MTNPWGLTNRECDTIEAVALVGSDKLAARNMGVAPRTVEIYMHSVRKKMGLPNRVLVVLAWDRFTRGVLP